MFPQGTSSMITPCPPVAPYQDSFSLDKLGGEINLSLICSLILQDMM